MNVIVIGGGKVGFYLTKTLIEHGHNATIIEISRKTCFYAANNLDIQVVHGDGTNTADLEAAGIEDCDAIISVTGQDEINLISCQLAKRLYKVHKTIAKVNNPKNAEVMRKLGIDIAISSTDNIARLLEHEVDTAKLKQLVAINNGESAICETVLPDNYKLHKKSLSEIELPNTVIIISISRGGSIIIPRGDTQLLSGDKIMFMAQNESMHDVKKALHLTDD